jgi:hypothetical protein
MFAMALPTDDAIAAETNAVLRNLCITQRYHDLSLALAQTIGGPNVNWSTFATWASKTAGQSIRNEEVPTFVSDLVGDAENEVMHPFGKVESVIASIVPTTGFHASFLLAPIQETIGTVSVQIADGNREVFAELAPLFQKFVDRMRVAPDPGGLGVFFGSLDKASQPLLFVAFQAYFDAMKQDDPVEKARLMLLGNCKIGLHEQTRLQPQIELAMDAPVNVILRQHLHDSLDTGSGKGLFAQLVDAIEKPLVDLTSVVKVVWERVATRYLMSLSLPGGAELPLGRNIPKDASAPDYVPPPLQNITAPSDLLALLQQYDRARGATDVGSACVDWRMLPDRMNFIVNLFRSRQLAAELLDPPFNEAQQAAILDGRVPDPTDGKL